MTRTRAFRLEGRAMKRPARGPAQAQRQGEAQASAARARSGSAPEGDGERATAPADGRRPLFVLDWEGAVLASRREIDRICGDRLEAELGRDCPEGGLARAWQAAASDPRRRGSGRLSLLCAALRIAAARSDLPPRRARDFRALADSLDARLAGNPGAARDEVLGGESPPGSAAILGLAVAWEGAVERDIARAGPFHPCDAARAAIDAMAALGDLALVGGEDETLLLRGWKGRGLPGDPLGFGGEEEPRVRFERAAAGREGLVLFVSDSDQAAQAARSAGARFHAIRPGEEEDSWLGLSEEHLLALMRGAPASYLRPAAPSRPRVG